MTNLAIHRDTAALLKPEPRAATSIRAACESDLAFIDTLQKRHGKAVAFASTTELRSYIADGTALLAIEETSGESIGYCLYRDRYMKREDCGVVSQLVVDAGRHRGLVGAAMIQAMFERLPYGVRLFCLWCAQDLQANHFWEALGFVPLAFRSGSRGKEHGGRRAQGTRLHIFWQRRVREGDDYPYWFPSQTVGGRMGEARIVLPIEPGTHWSDVKLVMLPGELASATDSAAALPEGESGGQSKPKRERRSKAKTPQAVPNPIAESGGLWFAPPAPATPPSPTTPPAPSPEEIKAAKAAERKLRAPRQKNDPKLVAAAREFRDRYLDEVNSGRCALEGAGKYEVSRQLPASALAIEPLPSIALLDAA